MYGPKILPSDPHVILHTTKDCGLDEETLFSKTLPTAEEFCSPPSGQARYSPGFVQTVPVHLGPCWVSSSNGFPTLLCLAFSMVLFQKLIIDGFFNEGPGTCTAALAHVEE